MARWRLTGKHYIHIEGTEWEYKETDQATGQQGRKVFAVPRHLDPDNPRDCNYPGECIVATKASAQYPRDHIFSGPPTPDMEPLDEEAEAITEATRDSWVHPIESLPPNANAMLPSEPRAARRA